MPARVIRTDSFLQADSLFPGVSPDQQYKRFELENCVMSVAISEMTVIALLRSMPGMVQSNWTAFP